MIAKNILRLELDLILNIYRDWETGWNDKYGCDVLTFEERLYQGLTNVMYPPEKEVEE